MTHRSVDPVLGALGDPTRRAIVARLRDGPLPVGELAAGLPVSRPAVSRHLRVLERARIVDHASVGTRNVYRLRPDGLADLRAWVDELWDTALARYAAALSVGGGTDPEENRR